MGGGRTGLRGVAGASEAGIVLEGVDEVSPGWGVEGGSGVAGAGEDSMGEEAGEEGGGVVEVKMDLMHSGSE